MALTNAEADALFVRRQAVWHIATEMAAPILEKHELTQYSQGPFMGQSTVYTPVDQTIEAIQRIADWLLEGS